MEKSNQFSNYGSPSIEEINTRLQDESAEHGLVVTPLVSSKQIQSGSIDIRLGNEFIITKKTRFDSLDPSIGKEKVDSLIKQYQEKVYVELGNRLILHPNQFVLGSTLEHVKLPYDLLAYVIGRSSWGRLGLIIATATVINPGYSGAITLELTNVGDTPITLYPSTRIAQLVFHTVNPSKIKPEKSKYEISTGPVFSKIHEDHDWSAFKHLKKNKMTLKDLITQFYNDKEISQTQYEKLLEIISNKNNTTKQNNE